MFEMQRGVSDDEGRTLDSSNSTETLHIHVYSGEKSGLTGGEAESNPGRPRNVEYRY